MLRAILQMHQMHQRWWLYVSVQAALTASIAGYSSDTPAADKLVKCVLVSLRVLEVACLALAATKGDADAEGWEVTAAMGCLIRREGELALCVHDVLEGFFMDAWPSRILRGTCQAGDDTALGVDYNSSFAKSAHKMLARVPRVSAMTHRPSHA
jgi:hypothetical protein